MTRQTTRLTQLTIIALLLTILVGSPPAEARPPAAPALQTITVNLENFGGEGSFMDGYDFSAQAVQRYGEEGPDRPELAPDFYYSEGYPIAGPIGFDIVNTIDFGAVGLGDGHDRSGPGRPALWAEYLELWPHLRPLHLGGPVRRLSGDQRVPGTLRRLAHRRDHHRLEATRRAAGG